MPPRSRTQQTFPFGPILFVGDSVTAGWVADNPGWFSGPQAVPRGIAGQATRDTARRLRSEIAFYGAKGLHLLCGRDDLLRPGAAADAVIADLRAMLTDARDLYVRAWVGTIPPVADPSGAAAVAAVNAWLRAEAAGFGAHVIDYDPALADAGGGLRPGLGDGAGLGAAGYAALEAVTLAALTAPGLDQIWPPQESAEAAARRKFLHHFGYLDSNTRLPAPFIQFAGKPGASHYGVPFDADGFLNAAPVPRARAPGETRVFVVGDSTVVDGGDIAHTLPGRVERLLRADGLSSARVYNFGVMSACLTQMAHLVWSRLLDLAPDAIVVVGGCTDLFQPWTYDPRPGHPYNAFIVARLYDHFFDTHDPRAREDGLSYDGLLTLIYDELQRLRAEAGWKSPAWEAGIVHAYERATHRLAKLSHDHGVQVVAALQPVVVRKRRLTDVERAVASQDFLAYLDRQYARLEAFTGGLAQRRPFRSTFRAVDLSGVFAEREAATFHDIVHYDDAGREIVARRLADEVAAALARARPAGPLARAAAWLRARR